MKTHNAGTSKLFYNLFTHYHEYSKNTNKTTSLWQHSFKINHHTEQQVLTFPVAISLLPCSQVVFFTPHALRS